MNSILLLILIGLAAGILSGVVGIGGGIILVPALVMLLHYNQHLAQGTSLAMLLLPTGLLAVWNYYESGYVNIRTALLLGAGFFVGAYFGSKFAVQLPDVTVKRIFGAVLLLVAIRMLFFSK